MNIGVHASHCCKWHGCKYGNENCPVITGKAQQEYLCECCCVDLENEEHYRQVLKDIEEMKRFKHDQT